MKKAVEFIKGFFDWSKKEPYDSKELRNMIVDWIDRYHSDWEGMKSEFDLVDEGRLAQNDESEYWLVMDLYGILVLGGELDEVQTKLYLMYAKPLLRSEKPIQNVHSELQLKKEVILEHG